MHSRELGNEQQHEILQEQVLDSPPEMGVSLVICTNWGTRGWKTALQKGIQGSWLMAS